MINPLVFYPLNPPTQELDPSGLCLVTERLFAQVVDAKDRVIVNAVVEAARDAGISELYLIDRDFVISAITEKLERMKEESK